MFTDHIEITDKSTSTGFDQYLLIDSDNGFNCEAYAFDDQTPMDIETMLQEVYSEHEVSLSPAMGGPNYAAIITDGRTPDSVVVWQHTDFYLVGYLILR